MTETSELFQQVSAIARAAALPVLRERANREGMIITICAWCNAYVSEQPGRGVSGISHGICNSCLEKRL